MEVQSIARMGNSYLGIEQGGTYSENIIHIYSKI
ncbi:MAG: hypothetical protein K0R69_2065 [Clostridia bacterium]|jgi:hypothetical protein|nr:hypothetical protein [Clostridia bacterium]